MPSLSKNMMKIGLTGGIATGKSSVSRYLREKGYQVIDADSLVHELQAPGGQLYKLLLEKLGPVILHEDGSLNRPLLAERFFQNQDLRSWSDQAQGAIIRQELRALMERAEEGELLFMDIPLLFEQDYETWFDQIWLVTAPEEVQMERLMARNNLDIKAAKARIASQMPMEAKKKRAHFLLDNGGSLEATYQQIDRALERMD